jgi:hypothetical protein
MDCSFIGFHKCRHFTEPTLSIADHGSRAVWGMNSLRSLGCRDRRFESYWGMDVCVGLFCVVLGSGLAIGWSLIQGVLDLKTEVKRKCFTDALCSNKNGSNRNTIQYSLC